MLKPARLPPQRREKRTPPVIDAAPHSLPEPRFRFASLTLLLGIAGSLLLFAAFPPLNLPWLAWVAPVPWLWLVRLPQLPGRRPYLALWLAGTVHWLAMLQGIRLAHPALYAGWIALAAYLGAYLPVFVGLTRVAVQRLKVSLIVAAPVVWVGLELLRGYLITGFSMGQLAHTQAELPILIQISDLAGGYALSFVILLVAACLARMIPLRRQPSQAATIAWWPVAPAAAAVGLALVYGSWRLQQTPLGATGPTVHVALIQGSLDTVFEITDERVRQTYEQYESLTARATAENQNLELVVWPESMFIIPERVIEEPLQTPPASELSADEYRARLMSAQEDFRVILAKEASLANANTEADKPPTLLLVGTTTLIHGAGPPRIYNAALLADRAGHVIGRYYKTHPVMFGEYIPFADVFPWLYRITPMAAGLSVGDGPKVFEVGGLKMSPSVCFESVLPHLVRRQLAELARRGTPADVLVNVTNDGWFWGSSILDLHFRCGIFRAVENRKPFLVAANTGISGWIDGSGAIRERGQRRHPEVIVAAVQTDGRFSPYQVVGDWPAWLCAGAGVGLAVIGWRQKRAAD
jgi:apolipoprotein N-acyltransferase